MHTIKYKTISAKPSTIQQKWWIVDGSNQIVGRLISKIVHYLQGKHKTLYSSNLLCGDQVIIIHADKVRFTGAKMRNKNYISHSGYPGGQKSITPQELQAKDPTKILEKAVKGMLPKNKLGKLQFQNLHIYTGGIHPHAAQQPEKLPIV